MTHVDHRAWPCAGCPWRTDTDLSAFSLTDVSKLARTNGSPGDEASLTTPTMACHQDQLGTRHARRLCAGWLAVVGRDHLGVRFAVLTGRLPEQVLDPGTGWPQLYNSLTDMLNNWPEDPTDTWNR